jgi:hypothetical protein
MANAGWLSMEGTNFASSFIVNSGGTLTGSNPAFIGPVTVLSGGTLDPGVSPGGSAIITLDSLAMSSGSTFVVDLNGVSSPGRVAVGERVNLGGSTLIVNDNFGSVIGDNFNIIPNDGADAIVAPSRACPKARRSRSGRRPSASVTSEPTETTWF